MQNKEVEELLPLLPQVALGAIPDSQEEKNILIGFERMYCAIADRLLALNSGKNLRTLHNPLIIAVKPHADLMLARRKMVNDCFPKLPRFSDLTATPAEVWFLIEVSQLKGIFWDLGMIDSPLTDERGKTYGKRKHISERRKSWKALKEAVKTEKVPQSFFDVNDDPDRYFLEILLFEAVEWAIEQDDSSLKRDINNFIKAQQQYIEIVDKRETAKEFCIPWLVGGAIAPTEKNKKRRKPPP